MIEQTRQRLNRWFLAKEMKKTRLKRNSIALASARTALILTDATIPNALQAALQLRNQLVEAGKQVEVVLFNDKPSSVEPPPNVHHISRKDLDWALRPKSDIRQSLLDRPFDLLFYLVDKPRPELDFMVATSKARFRIGPYVGVPGVCELMIVPDTSDLPKFSSLMLFYLEKLNPKNQPSPPELDEPKLVSTPV